MMTASKVWYTPVQRVHMSPSRRHRRKHAKRSYSLECRVKLARTITCRCEASKMWTSGGSAQIIAAVIPFQKLTHRGLHEVIISHTICHYTPFVLLSSKFLVTHSKPYPQQCTSFIIHFVQHNNTVAMWNCALSFLTSPVFLWPPDW